MIIILIFLRIEYNMRKEGAKSSEARPYWGNGYFCADRWMREPLWSYPQIRTFVHILIHIGDFRIILFTSKIAWRPLTSSHGDEKRALFGAWVGGKPLTQVGFFLARPEKGEEEKRTGEYAHQVAWGGGRTKKKKMGYTFSRFIQQTRGKRCPLLHIQV